MQDPRLALLLAHVFFNRGPYPYDMSSPQRKTLADFKVSQKVVFGYLDPRHSLKNGLQPQNCGVSSLFLWDLWVQVVGNGSLDSYLLVETARIFRIGPTKS